MNKKILTVSILAIMAVGAAHADIASTGYVTSAIDAKTKVTAPGTYITVQDAAGNLTELDKAIKTNTDAIAGIDEDLTQFDTDLGKLETDFENFQKTAGETYQEKSTAAYQMGAAGGEWETMSQAQQDALNSGATKAKIDQIETNKAAIEQNTTDIGTNKAAIEQNKKDIAANKTDIGTNKTAIDKLNGDAQTDGSVAKQIADAIAEVDSDISGLETRIETNEGNISTNTTDITNLKSNKQDKTDSTPAKAGKYVTADTKVGASLTNLDEAIVAAEGNITSIEGDITNIEGDITNIQKTIGDVQDLSEELGKKQDKDTLDADVTKLEYVKKNAVDSAITSAKNELTTEINKKQNVSDSTAADGNYITAGVKVGENLGKLDTQLKTASDDAAKGIADAATAQEAADAAQEAADAAQDTADAAKATADLAETKTNAAATKKTLEDKDAELEGKISGLQTSMASDYVAKEDANVSDSGTGVVKKVTQSDGVIEVTKGTVGTDEITDKAVTNAKIANDAIKDAQVAEGAQINPLKIALPTSITAGRPGAGTLVWTGSEWALEQINDTYTASSGN